MFRSISWQLQFSYGLLLLLALVGLGMFGFQSRKSEMLREVDEGLQIRSRQINSMLVRYDLNRLANSRESDNASEIPSLPPFPGSPEDVETGDRTLPLYYKVWKAEDGALQLIFQSPESPELSDQIPLPKDLRETEIMTVNGSQRQIFNRAVRNHVILVGVDISDEKAKLNRFLVRMILWEVAFLVFFVLAGNWLTRRALSPLGQISETARTIADGALDQRIPVEGGSSELQDLSLVLNDSFDRLESSILRQREFTSNASHELRTPITAILAEGQSRPETIGEYRKSLDHCVETARSMGQLVDQLLDMARFDSGNHELHREATDLDILVSRAVQMIRPAAEEKSIQIEADLALIQAEVNSVRITQVVVNLLNNAVSYTGEGGRIQVRLSETEDTVEIAVEDNGVGISESDLPNIFNRFYRADKSRSDHGNHHFGLGLAISREIAIAHRGDLRVESEPGKGSIFVLSLPRETA
jgi:signal transduction histidine kinase